MALSNAQVSELQQQGEFAIKSESVTPKLGTLPRLGTTLQQTLMNRYFAMAPAAQKLRQALDPLESLYTYPYRCLPSQA